jgi:hypothetical protein
VPTSRWKTRGDSRYNNRVGDHTEKPALVRHSRLRGVIAITALLVLVVSVVLQMKRSVMKSEVMENASVDPESALPVELLGWRSAPEDRAVYDRESLYDYIDGGAELYLSYGFRRGGHRTYVHGGPQRAPDIIVDVFDMGTSQNAFGAFSHSRESVEAELGQGSQYTEGLLLFWQGRYYVSILASPETESSKRAVLELARIIEAAIGAEGPLPDILQSLPRDGLVESSIRYFRHYIWLNSHYFVSDENILHINENTDAVLATYGHGGGRRILLVVRYPDGAAAREAYDEFAAHYLPELSQGAAVRIEDGTWTGCKLRGDTIAVVFNAATTGDAIQLIDAVLDGPER